MRSFCSFSEGSHTQTHAVLNTGAEATLCWSVFHNIQARRFGRRWRADRWKGGWLLRLLESCYCLVSHKHIHYLSGPWFGLVVSSPYFKRHNFANPWGKKDAECLGLKTTTWSGNGVSLRLLLVLENKSIHNNNRSGLMCPEVSAQHFQLPKNESCTLKEKMSCPSMFRQIQWICKNCWSTWTVCVAERNNCNCCLSSPPCGAD